MEQLNKLIDHTYLKAFGTLEDIDKLIEEAKRFQFKSVCVNPSFVKYCDQKLKGSGVLVCTVIGFPLGANTKETKVFETLNAVTNGADEIDMVINISQAKMHEYAYIADEVRAVVKAAGGLTVKVIIETCYLTPEEVLEITKTVAKTGAKFIKTSTGFGTDGATVENVKIMKENGGGLEVKASGGVKTIEDLRSMVKAGATRIGTSNGVKILEGEAGSGY